MNQQNTKRDSLLEYIARESKCTYISDLHNPENASKIYEALSILPYENYSLNEWKDTLLYILKDPSPIDTVEEAYQQLLIFFR